MSAQAHRFGVLINPTAGHGRGRRKGHEVVEQMQARGLTVVNLTRSTPREAFEHALARRDEYDVLIAVGGDGMAHMGINLVAGTSIPLGLIAVGSGNDFARHLGLPIHRVTEGIDTILTCLRTGPEALDALRLTPCNGQNWRAGEYPTAHRWAGCVVSAGFDSMVNSRANTYTWPRGMGRYIRGVFRELLTFSPYRYRMSLDGVEESFRGTLVAVANAPSFGGGMQIAPGAHPRSGRLEVVIAGAISRLGLLRVFPRVYTGGHLDHPVVRTATAREVTIGPAEGAVIPEIFADGELVGAGPVRIEVKGGALQMLCPRLEV